MKNLLFQEIHFFLRIIDIMKGVSSREGKGRVAKGTGGKWTVWEAK